MRNKPEEYGLKLFLFCDSHWNAVYWTLKKSEKRWVVM